MPLSDRRGRVAALLQDFGDGELSCGQAAQGIREQHPGLLVRHSGPDRQPAGEEARPTRRAHARRDIEIGPPLPLGGHAVQVRRSDRRVAVDPEIAVAEIVGKDDHDVRRRRSGRRRREAQQREDGCISHGCVAWYRSRRHLLGVRS